MLRAGVLRSPRRRNSCDENFVPGTARDEVSVEYQTPTHLAKSHCITSERGGKRRNGNQKRTGCNFETLNCDREGVRCPTEEQLTLNVGRENGLVPVEQVPALASL